MGSYTLGEAAAAALGGARLGRSATPVRRGSVEAGSFEHGFFAAPAPGETDRLLRVARAVLDAGRRLKRVARAERRALGATERLAASLTAGAVRVLEELLALARLNGGRVHPSYDRLADRTGLGRATVARAISCLEAVGFLARQRRFRRVDGEGAGPRYAQTSNAYRLLAPRRLMRLLPRRPGPAPLPDCEEQRRAERATEHAAMLGSLGARELADATVGGALGRALARLGAALDRRTRESHDDPESLHQLIHPAPAAASSIRWTSLT